MSIATACRFGLDSVPFGKAKAAKTVSQRNLFSEILFDGGFRAVPIAVCPECESELHVDEEMDKGDTLVCEDCEAKLKVVGLDPIELDAVTAEDEDEDDFDEEEEAYFSRGRRRGRAYGSDEEEDY